MSFVSPIYTPANCKRFCAPLSWSLALFWRDPIAEDDWFTNLQAAVKADDVLIDSHRFAGPDVSQFLLRTQPAVSPAAFVRSVKGRLQYLIRERRPRAFQRNYGFRSVGTVSRAVIEGYVASQTQHHTMADPVVQRRLEAYQVVRNEVDLSTPRHGSHAEYWYNLHLVLVHADRLMEIREEMLRAVRDMIVRVAGKYDHWLSRAGILADHLHLVLGCRASESPLDVVLHYMNNLAYVQGMVRAYQFGFFAGTVGEYDLNAIQTR